MIVSTIKKEILEMVHDRTMLAVLLAFPVFVMIFMGSSFRSLEINGLPVGLAGPVNTSFSQALFSGLNESKAFNLQDFGSEEEAMTAFRNGQLRAVIVVPEDFEESLRRGEGSKIRIVVDNSDLALEQSVLAAMSSVIEASSADITKGYVTAAWEELRGLNDSAAALASDIAGTRLGMQQTKAALAGARADMDSIDAGRLEGSLGNASVKVAALQALLEEQKGALSNASADNQQLLAKTEIFLINASSALDESIDAVDDTHGKLASQVQELNQTVSVLDSSIAGLEAIKSGTNDTAMIAALELNIASLQALRNSTAGQIEDAKDEMDRLEELNTTLYSFGGALDAYSVEVQLAKAGANRTAEMASALDNVSASLDSLDSSFAEAKEEVAKLKALLSSMKATVTQIDSTLDDALNQTASVDSLISSLQGTVAEQTGKDPDLIASPLSVEVQNQYARGSFVDFIMPQVISISLLLSCFLLGSISLVREKMRKTIVRALMVPWGLWELVIGKIVALVLLSFGQIALILAVALLLFGVRPPENMAVLVYGTAISALVLSSIGVLVGFFSKSESAAIQSCLLLAIPMLFLGNIIFSPDLLPSYTQVLQQLLPLAHVTSIFKIVLITDGDPAIDIAALMSYFVLLAALLGFVSLKRRDITNYV
ncbi:MAG: ABC transporter permease [Candidatus Micrarchaeota archaeon]